MTTYVPSVDPFIDSSQKQVRAIREEGRTTLEQIKPLANIIALGLIKLVEAAQLWELVVSACWRLM